MSIDMHAHWIPKRFADVFRARKTAPRIYRTDDGREMMDTSFIQNYVPEGFDDPKVRLDEMDKNSIQRGVLSLTPVMGVEAMPADESVPLCRAFNDSLAEMCALHPDRFSALAALPVSDFGEMQKEFERVMTLPGFVGAVVPSDGFLSAKRAEQFRPLLDAADRHGAMIMVHYGKLAGPSEKRVDTSDNNHARIGTLDMQSSLSQNMVTFCMTDFLRPYQNLTMMSHNLGGNIAYEIERMDHRSIMDRPKDELPSKRIRAGRYLVDCNSLHARGIELAVHALGADKITVGTDGTAFGMKWTMEAIRDARIDDADKRAILSGNAAKAMARVNAKMAEAAE